MRDLTIEIYCRFEVLLSINCSWEKGRGRWRLVNSLFILWPASYSHWQPNQYLNLISLAMLRLTLMLLLLLLLLLQWKCRRACATWRMSNGPTTMLCISLAIVHHFVDKLPPLSPLASSGQTAVPHVNLMPWQLQAQQTHSHTQTAIAHVPMQSAAQSMPETHSQTETETQTQTQTESELALIAQEHGTIIAALCSPSVNQSI